MTKKKTTEQFIQEAKAIHGDKYDYSLVEYKGNRIKVKIICKDCEQIFETTPFSHITMKSRCTYCYGNIKKTTEQFIQEAKGVHGDNYNYSLVKYEGNKNDVEIICNECNVHFYQRPFNHIVLCQGCPICYGTPKKTTEQFIQEAKAIHGDKYDYKLVNYETTDAKVQIVCKECNVVFNQTPYVHINARYGCPTCAIKLSRENLAFTTEEFILKAKQIHGDKYDYKDVEYKNCMTEVKIYCLNCNKYFFQKPIYHTFNKCDCPNCSSKGYSKAAIKWLESLKETYPDIQHALNGGEYKIPGTSYKVDGYSPSTKTVLEYHGAFWHCCPCCYPDGNAIHPITEKTMYETFEKTKEKRKIILELGFNYGYYWDCGHKPSWN